MLKVAKRGTIAPFIVMDVLAAANERAAKGADVLHLEMGQPGSGTPRGVIEAAAAALGADPLGYTEALGIPALRRRIAQYYRDTYGVAVDPARVVVTTGSSGAFVLAFLAAFEPGDRVAIADPSYPAYRNILTALGVTVVPLLAGAETRFQPTVALIAALDPPPDGLIVQSPSNPAGTMIDDAELARLARYCRANGIRFVSDEIYHGIAFARACPTALAADPQAIAINSFSKYFSMTGWRIGWMVCPDDLARAVECLAQNFYISPPTLSQLAALAVFDCADELRANVARYQANRALLLARLPGAGFDRIAPSDGAFYLYADVAQLTNDSDSFCAKMLAETGVATAPGIDFDPARGRAFVRFSFAGATEDMARACDRLEKWAR